MSEKSTPSTTKILDLSDDNSFADITSGEPTNFNLDVSDIAQETYIDDEYDEDLKPFSAKLSDFVKNFKSKPLTFNHGEPAPLAFKKMFKELLYIFLFFVIIFALFFSKQFVLSKLGSKEMDAFIISSTYDKVLTFDQISISANKDDSSQTVYNSFYRWSKDDFEAPNTASQFPSLLCDQLNAACKTYDVSLIHNLSDYDYFIAIYDNMSKGLPVIVSLSSIDKASITYAYVTKIDANQNSISVLYVDGTKSQLTIDEFIDLTRYKDVDGLSFQQNIGYLTGVYSINSAFLVCETE